MKRRAVIAAIWAAGLALILINGWTTAMWIYFAGALSKDEKALGQKKQRSYRGIYANESGEGDGGTQTGVGETMGNGGRGIMLSPRYNRDQLYRDAANSAQAAEDRRSRAD